jgi:hypothetical protein
MSSGRIVIPLLFVHPILRGREEWKLDFALESKGLMGVSHSGHWNIPLDG